MRVTFLEEYSGNGFSHAVGATQELPDDVAQQLIKTKRARVADPLPDVETATDEPTEDASNEPTRRRR